MNNVVQWLVTGMILIIIATVTLAVLSYAAFKVRDRKSGKGGHAAPASTEALFFERVRIAAAPAVAPAVVPVRRDG
jgi:hypothetical protein